MMAQEVTIHYIDEEGWSDIYAYVYQKGGSHIGPEWHGTKCTDIKVDGDKRVATWTLDLKGIPASNACVVFNNGVENGPQHPKNGGWDVKDGANYTKNGIVTKVIKLFNGSSEVTGSNGNYTLDLSIADAKDATIKLSIDGVKYGLTTAQTINAVGTSDIAFTTGGAEALTLKAGLLYSITVTDEGKMTVVASEKGTGVTTKNPLAGRVYTQGYYLAGNFFNFSEGKVTYDDAVFKFQQQKNETINKVVYAVYKVEIPASLTAHAQVMSVNELGKKLKVYGPGSAHGISYTNPTTTVATTALSPLTGSEIFDETLDGTLNGRKNYWDIKSRNERADEYSDGMYEVFIYIPEDSSTGEPTKWKFKHIGNKRVAFFISNAKNATAMPVYDKYKKNENQFSNRFYASVNLSTEHSYYVISNYVMNKNFVDINNKDYIKELSSQYGAIAPAEGNAVHCPTTNKLFLLGNGGYVWDSNHNLFSPNEKPMKPAIKDQGSRIIEYNPSNGTDAGAKHDKHFGICGQVIIRGDADKQINSISMVGDAIPGTLNDNGTWNYASTAADMKYDETEKCYKVTLVTTVGEGAAKFRFVGNHSQKFNWYEDSEKAKTPYDEDGEGHAATSNDPNKVNYTENGLTENTGADLGIIWNRPAGRWTVRLFFYTYSDGNDPVTDYYYTISANKELELRDFEDVVYKSLDNKREILLRGDYKYFRSWSAARAWKISKNIDIFIVDGMSEGTDGKAKFSLKKITADPTGKDNVIPSNTGVILAATKTAAEIDHAEVYERASLTEYNTMVVPMEEYTDPTTSTYYYKGNKYTGDNLLKPLITARVVPTMEHTTYNNKEDDYYNYLFGFYHANKGMGTTDYLDNQFLLGFWISNGKGAFYSNSAYLPIAAADVEKMNLGVSYNDFKSDSQAKKVPALFFDFANADGTTGIDEVVNTTVKNHDGKYYTLSGQQVEKPTTSGVYIHNGKKFVVK